MGTVMVRVPKEVREALQELARASDRSIQSVLAEAVEQYRRRWMLEQTNAAYAELAADPEAWEELQKERQEWEVTSGDGIEDDR